jgi:arsenite transporter
VGVADASGHGRRRAIETTVEQALKRKAGPFVHAFLWIIAILLVLARLVQLGAARLAAVRHAVEVLGVLPVPATALVLFVVVAAVVPRLGEAAGAAARVASVYIAFAVAAPLMGWMAARLSKLNVSASGAVAFSAGTRNSLVVLPLAFAVPDGLPLVPAIAVTETLMAKAAKRWRRPEARGAVP